MPDQTYVTEFYKSEAKRSGDSLSSTVQDDVVRDKELLLIHTFLRILQKTHGSDRLRILDVGCGNGGTLGVLSENFPGNQYFGLDLCPEMVEIADERNLANCDFRIGDGRTLPYNDGILDVVFSEQCLTTIFDWEDKKAVLREIHRVLGDGCYYLMIEGFEDGLHNSNRVRKEAGLPDLAEPTHVAYFENDAFERFIAGRFNLIDPEEFDPNGVGIGIEQNFLSSHYFMDRVFRPLVSGDPLPLPNTEFVKFFSFLPPVGNYAPIQARILQKS